MINNSKMTTYVSPIIIAWGIRMYSTQLSCDEYFSSHKSIDIQPRTPQPDFPIHSHEFYELVLVLSGSAIHIIDGEAFPIGRGSIFYLNHRTMEHCYACMDNLCLTNVLINPEQFQGNRLLKILDESFSLPTSQLLVNEPTLHYCDEILSHINSENYLSDRYEQEMMTNLLGQLSILLWRCKEGNPTFKDNNTNTLYLIVNYLNENFNKKIDWESLCSHYSCSFRTLNRKMKSLFGLTPNVYLNRIRLCHASTLLKKRDNSITNIAFECGFNDGNYFSCKFHELFGMSPVNYRNQFSNY